MHTTNYYDTFIEVADDCRVTAAEIPQQKGDNKTVAALQFDMLIEHPYHYTSDDVVFGVYAAKNHITKKDEADEREKFFSKGQPCLRSSPLGKRYGWGIHSNAEGKVAIYPVESEEYKIFATDKNLKHVKAMRSKRA
ncbi:hypothetical protein EOD41_13830 [Mucilaginibacter limnophilus]|uniref:Uncharacterized protein n=1 Tax=Mucilaginibacter limnophilus TaxID=1932778 RepID=A0A3S2Y236_9SPHI|nr:DUF6157 family protein [Mucilaginibacter limnophilus]RVU00039.1 hypothetical protein EOD41_13830 [Mucilaginibacter limnophilus]